MMKKKWMLKIILVWIIVLSLDFCVNAAWKSDACVEDNQCDILIDQPYCVFDGENYTSCIRLWLTNKLTKNVSSRKDIIETYCEALQWDDKRQWRVYYSKPSTDEDYEKWDWQETFDSKQSLFVYALCSSFRKESEAPFIKWDELDMWEVFKWDVATILKLQQRSKKQDLCSLEDSPSLNDCDMSVYATEIFSAIMSEIFKISYAQSIGVDTTIDYDAKSNDRIEYFLSWYFDIIDGYEVLQTKFPQTIDVMKSNQLFYKKILDKLVLIDNDKLVDRAEKTKCPETWNIAWVDFIACALHWQHGNGNYINRAFLTMYYNEIMNYRIFINYYRQILDKMLINVSDNELKTIINNHSSEIERYSSIQLSAADQTLSDFLDWTMTYPLHIWLLMYQERMKNFRDKYFSPVVTIFYSLSEKLQNVQIPD